MEELYCRYEIALLTIHPRTNEGDFRIRMDQAGHSTYGLVRSMYLSSWMEKNSTAGFVFGRLSGWGLLKELLQLSDELVPLLYGCQWRLSSAGFPGT